MPVLDGDAHLARGARGDPAIGFDAVAAGALRLRESAPTAGQQLGRRRELDRAQRGAAERRRDRDRRRTSALRAQTFDLLAKALGHDPRPRGVRFRKHQHEFFPGQTRHQVTRPQIPVEDREMILS